MIKSIRQGLVLHGHLKGIQRSGGYNFSSNGINQMGYNQKLNQFAYYAPVRHFNTKSIYDEAKMETSDEERLNKIIIKNYKNPKDTSPNTIDIDANTGSVRQISKDHDSVNVKNVKEQSEEIFQRTFLPNGYPHTVTPNYIKFTQVSLIGSISFTAMGFLSTQSLFVALGGTTTQANIASAAVQWVLKDGAGQIGAILFAAKFGQNFDADIKKWRMMSVAVLNLAFWIEIMTLAFPKHFLLIASLANVGKNICFMLSSASRASINLRFAKNNNIADIQGKSVSQFTASSLVGYGIGLGLTRMLDVTSLYHLVPTFVVLSGIQAVTTHISTKVVDEIYLHNSRANMLFTSYFQSGESVQDRTFRDAADINSVEQFYLPNFLNHQGCNYIQYGQNSIGGILTSADYGDSMLHQLDKLEQQNRKYVYYIKYTGKRKIDSMSLRPDSRNYVIHVNLEKDAASRDVLRSYFLGRLIDIQLQQKLSCFDEKRDDTKLLQTYMDQAIRQAEWEFSQVDFDRDIEKPLNKAGWSLDFIYLDNKQNRFEMLRDDEEVRIAKGNEKIEENIDEKIKYDQ